MSKIRDSKRLYNKDLGYYFPSFFFMNINTDEELSDRDKWSTEILSTFCHESVHFLQDITSIYGLSNIYHTVDVQKAINKKFIENNSDISKLPINVDSKDIQGNNIDLFSLYHGDEELNCETFQTVNSINRIYGNIEGFEDVPEIEVNVKKGIWNDRFGFGAHCLQESMAYLIQDQLFDNVNLLQFPYRTAEYVCAHIYPEISKDKRNLIYMCDAALDVVHPGEFFFDVVSEMKEAKFIPENPKQIYIFFQKFFSKYYKPSDIGSFECISNKAENQILDYFTDPIGYFNPVKNWLRDMISSARKKRLDGFSFWSNILEKADKESRQKEFFKMLLEIGYPIIGNNKGHYFYGHPKFQLDSRVFSLRAIMEVRDILLGKSKSCGMIEFCKSGTNGDTTNSNCENSPWERANERKEKKACPFGQIWGMWGLSAKQPEIS